MFAYHTKKQRASIDRTARDEMTQSHLFPGSFPHVDIRTHLVNEMHGRKEEYVGSNHRGDQSRMRRFEVGKAKFLGIVVLNDGAQIFVDGKQINGVEDGDERNLGPELKQADGGDGIHAALFGNVIVLDDEDGPHPGEHAEGTGRQGDVNVLVGLFEVVDACGVGCCSNLRISQ